MALHTKNYSSENKVREVIQFIIASKNKIPKMSLTKTLPKMICEISEISAKLITYFEELGESCKIHAKLQRIPNKHILLKKNEGNLRPPD